MPFLLPARLSSTSARDLPTYISSPSVTPFLCGGSSRAPPTTRAAPEMKLKNHSLERNGIVLCGIGTNELALCCRGRAPRPTCRPSRPTARPSRATRPARTPGATSTGGLGVTSWASAAAVPAMSTSELCCVAMDSLFRLVGLDQLSQPHIQTSKSTEPFFWGRTRAFSSSKECRWQVIACPVQQQSCSQCAAELSATLPPSLVLMCVRVTSSGTNAASETRLWGCRGAQPTNQPASQPPREACYPALKERIVCMIETLLPSQSPPCVCVCPSCICLILYRDRSIDRQCVYDDTSCAGSVGACVPCNGDLPDVLETEEPLEPGATPTPVSPGDADTDTDPPFPVGEPLDRALVRPRKLQNGKCDVFG